MAGTYRQIAPDSTGGKIRVDEDYDASGNLVDAQAMLPTDQRGHRLNLLTEETGQVILGELKLLREAICNALDQPYFRGPDQWR